MHKILAELRAKGVSAETISEFKRLIEEEASRKAKALARLHKHRAKQNVAETFQAKSETFQSKPLKTNNGETFQAASSLYRETTSKEVPSEIDLERDLFLRGKQILGQNAGGFVAKLLKAKGGSLELTRAVIEQAATKQDPREYVGRVLAAMAKQKTEYHWTDHLAL